MPQSSSSVTKESSTPTKETGRLRPPKPPVHGAKETRSADSLEADRIAQVAAEGATRRFREDPAYQVPF